MSVIQQLIHPPFIHNAARDCVKIFKLINTLTIFVCFIKPKGKISKTHIYPKLKRYLIGTKIPQIIDFRFFTARQLKINLQSKY